MTLLERDGELRTIEGTLERAACGAGGLVMIEAQAGAGKTAIMRAAAGVAERTGLRVLRGRGTELERAFAFGLVRQLLERVVADEPELAAATGSRAASVLAPGAPASGAEEELFGALDSLHWLVADLAAHAPLAIFADDVHWADSASLRFLAFVAERIEELPVAVVVATRPSEPGADRVLLDVLATSPGATVLRPAQLSPAAVAELTASRIGRSPDPAFAAACHRATGGNPFLLGELLGELAADGVAGAAADADGVLDFGIAGVSRTVRRRLRPLGPEAAALAGAVAVLGSGARLADAARLAALDRGAATDAADALAAIDVLTAGPRLDFVHPLVRAAVYDDLAPQQREALHAGAAELLSAADAGPERVGLHLLNLTPSGDTRRVTTLRAAAATAAARGDAEAAARFGRRALQEPPPAAERGAVLHELGLAEAANRRRAEFEEHLRAALWATEDGEGRGRIALDLGRALAASGEFAASLEVFDEALAGLDDRESALAVRLEAELMTVAFNDFTGAGVAAPHWVRRTAMLAAGEPLHAVTRAWLALGLVTAHAPASDGVALAEQVIDAALSDAETNSVIAGSIGNALLFGGRLQRAAWFYDETIATATRRGSRLDVSWQVVQRADASLRLGETRRAEAEARLGLDLCTSGSGPAAFAWAVAHLLGPLVVRGALDEAQALLDEGHVGSGAPPSFALALLHSARSRLRLAQGDPAAALADARGAQRIAASIVSNPMALPWRSDAALALAVLDRHDEALGLADEELALARAFAVRDAEGAALRTVGMVTGEPATLRESVAVLEGAEGALELARSVLELGSALRRAGQRSEGRDVLRRALDLATRAGAGALADRAHAELVAAGARPRRDRRLLTGREALTAGEDRVATLAAEGLTNREIAQRLFVTVKAVQWHLRNVYRKLEIASREELPEALEPGDQDKTLGGVD